jgi:hypothetical protein
MSNLSISPAKVNKVNRLLLFLKLRSDINLASLLSALPNVQTLYTVEYEMEDILFDQHTVFPFFNHIQSISEAVNNTITRNILQSYSCLNLTNLHLRDFGRDIVSLLKHVSNLLSLNYMTNITSFILMAIFFEQQITSLNDSDCRIQHLTVNCKFDTILSQLATSNQILYIHTLVLHEINPGSLVLLNQFRVLVKLKFYTKVFQEDDYAVSFSDIMTCAPSTLKSLSFMQSILCIDSDYQGVSHSIEKLTLNMVELLDGIDAFL